jgi:hypothetical protein
MRSRIVDIALLVGLVAVAGGILWTLFTLGSGPRTTRPAPTPTVDADTRTPADPALVEPDPVAADPTPGPAGGVVAVDPDDEPSVAGADAVPADDASPDEEPGEVAEAPERRAPLVPGGTIELERVGFSFVTGGAGACGVTLEAWTHVAVSRDLLDAYGCGAEVVVTLEEPVAGRSEVVGVIGDTMNPSFERTVNVYVAEDEPAFEYGTTSGTFTDR